MSDILVERLLKLAGYNADGTRSANRASELGERAYDSLETNGGFSLQLDGEPVPPGYYTSVRGFERVIPLRSITPRHIDHFIHDHRNELRKPGNFIGAWVSDDDVYLDVSRAFGTPEEAVAFGRANGQQAAWDGFNNSEIPIPSDVPLQNTPVRPQEAPGDDWSTPDDWHVAPAY